MPDRQSSFQVPRWSDRAFMRSQHVCNGLGATETREHIVCGVVNAGSRPMERTGRLRSEFAEEKSIWNKHMCTKHEIGTHCILLGNRG